MHDDLPKDDQSVWSSYSDLFTNVAIIFLVMFVFALVKSGVNQMDQIQTKRKHKNELAGKLSPKDLQIKDKRISKIRQKVEEMREYEDIIDLKVRELNSYAKKMQENKEVMREVIESQLKQDSMMKAAEESLEAEKKIAYEKKVALEEAQIKINLLDEKLQRAQLEVRQKEDTLNRELAKKMAEANQKENELKTLMIKRDEDSQLKVAALKRDIETTRTAAETQYKQRENELLKEMNSLNQNLTTARSDAKKLNDDLKAQASAKAGQESNLAKLKREFQELESQLNLNKEARYRLTSEKLDLSRSIASINSQNEQLSKDYEALRKSLGSTSAKSKELEAKLQASENSTVNWKRALEQKGIEAEKLLKDLAASQKKFGDLARTMSALKDSVKNDVANRLIGKFKEHGLDSKVDKVTGEVVLLSGEGFNFEKGSAKLSKEAKAILKKVIPVYTAVLFEDDKVLSQLASINMEGHSSPSFGGKYVSPEETNSKAYGLNMRLSAQRAASVADYLMGDEIGNYAHKGTMKKHLQAVGFGYMRPLAREQAVVRGPASVTTTLQECGPWDCDRSQRVQINFLLKDNIEEIRKIIDSNGGIK